jgi:hypothetical protein
MRRCSGILRSVCGGGGIEDRRIKAARRGIADGAVPGMPRCGRLRSPAHQRSARSCRERARAQLVEFGFVRRNLRRIHLQAIASNTVAIRAYEKAGFVVEGRQRQHAWVRGSYEDIVLMGILRSEQTLLA